MESLPLFSPPDVHSDFDPNSTAVLHTGDALRFLQSLPDGLATLIISSPPYNLGKEYERRQNVRAYLDGQTPVLTELARVLADNGSLRWEVGTLKTRILGTAVHVPSGRERVSQMPFQWVARDRKKKNA